MGDVLTPLHDRRWLGAGWFACEQPERPHQPMGFNDTVTGEDRQRWLSEVLAVAEARYGADAGEPTPSPGAGT